MDDKAWRNLMRPVSGALPKQEKSVAKNVSSTFKLPQDAVEMHENPEAKNRIIIGHGSTGEETHGD
jgi:hypothetical protein